MPESLILPPRAVDDMRRAAEWYDKQQRGLGSTFDVALRQCLVSVESFPDSFPLVLRDIRQAMVKAFPAESSFVGLVGLCTCIESFTTRAITAPGVQDFD